MSTRAVFRGYDRAALDREYDNRNKVPGFDLDAFVAECARRSDRVRAGVASTLDVAYGDGAAERLDVFHGAGAAPHPIMVFFHGGYWRAGRRADFVYVAGGLAPAGITTVVAGYPLVPIVDLDVLVDRCRAALAWTWRNAAALGGDPARVNVSGHSAGGHLVAMLLATDWPAFASDLPADPIRGAVGLSGIYDLEPIRHSFLNDVLGLDAASAARNSPVRLVPRCGRRLVLAVGASEGPEYLRQQADLASAWAGRGLAIEPHVLAGHDHFTIRAGLDDPDDAVSSLLRRSTE